MKIVPALNAKTFKEIVEKINLLKEATTEFHLDVARGEFTNEITWKNSHELKRLPENLNLDLHLMLQLKPQEILSWNDSRVKRLILHLDQSLNPDGLLRLAKKTRKEIFLALTPTSEKELLTRYLPYVQGILILGVHPGQAGQIFQEQTYTTLTWARALLKPGQQLMIDGGIQEENLKKILSYQPDFIVMASAIFNNPNPRERFFHFQELLPL